MSLPRISFLEGWERNLAFTRGQDSPSDSECETTSFQDLPETASLSSSFPSTYSRLNFNPYAGPGWSETAEDHEDRPLSSLARVVSPTSTRDTRVEQRPASPALVSLAGPVREPLGWSETTSAFEVSPGRRIGKSKLWQVPLPPAF